MYNSNKMYFYNEIADQFDSIMNMYDTNRRLEVIFKDFLLQAKLDGKKLLDGGSGTGWFSKMASDYGADVTSLDVGVKLLRQVSRKCKSNLVAGSLCDLPFPDENFDIVLSSEVIEHTPDPRRALHELCRVLKKDGVLVLTVPNRTWHFSVRLANALKIRPYDGYENWVGYCELRRWLEEEGISIEKYRGIHLFPFIFKPTYPLLRFFDNFGDALGLFMVNIAVKGIKK